MYTLIESYASKSACRWLAELVLPCVAGTKGRLHDDNSLDVGVPGRAAVWCWLGVAGNHVHNITVREDVCALNLRYQIGLWWDNPFFGPHPSASVGSKGTPYDPAACGIRFDKNVYWHEDQQQLALWGCPWRPKHIKVANLHAWQTEFGQDAHSLEVDPGFSDLANNDWSLSPESPARRVGAGCLRVPGGVR